MSWKKVVGRPHKKRDVWIEAKAKGGKLRPEQAAWLASLRRVGHVAEVVRSMEEFKAVIEMASARAQSLAWLAGDGGQAS